MPARNSKTGQRDFFFGPVTKAQAEHLADYILDDQELRSAVVRLLTHDLAPGELDYIVQMMAEAREETEKESA